MIDDYNDKLTQFINSEKDKLAVKPNGFFGNWAFYEIKRKEFKKIWTEARHRASSSKDDGFE